MGPLQEAVKLALETAKLALDERLSSQEIQEIVTQAVYVEALQRAAGNVCSAAKMLKVHRNTANRILLKHTLNELPRKIREANKQPKLAFMKPPRAVGAGRAKRMSA